MIYDLCQLLHLRLNHLVDGRGGTMEAITAAEMIWSYRIFALL